ncbi:MAG: ferrochelatase [Aquificae bacterium]|nr:ferrochelatase [Aquificota bacterium]
MGKTAVVLLNMGGPDSLQAVEPFLYNLFSDHNIIRIPKVIQKPVAKVISKVRGKKVREYYKAIGGKSPQREQTEKQAEALKRALGDGFDVFVAMRYWHPLTEEAVERIKKGNYQKVILLPLYPHYSKTTTGSSFQEFEKHYKGIKTPLVKIHSYHNHPTFIKSWVENIKQNLPNYQDYYFLFSAHSLPKKVILEGDPYQKQIEENVKLIMENFNNPYTLSYQSKVSPVEWIKPFTDETIKRLASEGVKKLAVIPISFVSEHIETLYELDIQYKELANSLGIQDYRRIPTFVDFPPFIQALKEITVEHM